MLISTTLLISVTRKVFWTVLSPATIIMMMKLCAIFLLMAIVYLLKLNGNLLPKAEKEMISLSIVALIRQMKSGGITKIAMLKVILRDKKNLISWEFTI
jgi:hypothetical protein